ncbi:conserved exported protein of unknown function [Rhodovastum atsumiense]|uniref:Lipoprotein n=1 Tax=Rhodovastum atsumiense TaxID=504468 RepID=A0A5M6J511_9PROT|nr:hypothetical protein [Rhodovastum atsumiense]KAA5614725.1 hypothetical protein F1189_00930 [Rhodovastum atsumiense]CAH2599738.1 conserved exported protein of unknown function [Rhodovastum atsumiense]
MMRGGIILLLLACMALPGCRALLTEGTADAAGIAGAGIAGAVTDDATLGAAIGLGVRSVADAGLGYVQRKVHAAAQQRIATAAGALKPGDVGVWSIAHDIPIEDDERGQVTVARDFGGPGFACREIVFSVDGGTAAKPSRAFYTATVCRDGETWRWATAEPATERWGALQ